MKFTFKIWDKIKEAWPLYKEHFGVLLVMMLITIVAQLIGVKDNFVLMIISFIISILISYLWIRLILNIADKKEFNLFSKEALPTLAQFWNFFKTFILYLLSVLGGFILFIIPGFYVSGRLVFAVYLSVEKNQGGRVTVKEAWKMTEGYGWQLFWINLIIGLFMAVGFVAFFVGSFITYPLGMIVIVMMYREFSKMKLQNPSEPASVEVVKELPKEVIKEENTAEVKH